MNNLWSIKASLRGFELIFGLSVNIYGINLKINFMQVASSFLYCYVDRLTFKILGVQIGYNSKRAYLWRVVVEKVRRRLSLWKGRYLSMGWKVVLINAILNVIPVYTVSFYKAPVSVLKEIISTQNKFL